MQVLNGKIREVRSGVSKPAPDYTNYLYGGNMATTTLPKFNKFLTEEDLVFIPHPNDKRFIDLTGHTSGQLTVLGFLGGSTKRKYWACRCACGNITRIDRDHLKGSATKSCGCHRRQRMAIIIENQTIHGLSSTPEYKTWYSMVDRCANPNKPRNKRYAGRGITVCERWQKFENFLEDMGKRPGPGYSIERINNDGHYEPGNCKWATLTEQANNKRNSHFIEFGGERKTVAEWCRYFKLDPEKDRWRVQRGLERGIPPEPV